MQNILLKQNCVNSHTMNLLNNYKNFLAFISNRVRKFFCMIKTLFNNQVFEIRKYKKFSYSKMRQRSPTKIIVIKDHR